MSRLTKLYIALIINLLGIVICTLTGIELYIMNKYIIGTIVILLPYINIKYIFYLCKQIHNYGK